MWPLLPQVRLYDALRGAGLPPAQLREAMLLRGAAAGNSEPPRLRLPSDEFILWVRLLLAWGLQHAHFLSAEHAL